MAEPALALERREEPSKQDGEPAPSASSPEAPQLTVVPTRVAMPPPAPYVAKHPMLAACYMAASVVIAITYGLGLNFVTANLYPISGELSATTNETMWLNAAYMAPNVSLTLLLLKIRGQYGLRRFAEVAIVVFVLVNALHLVVDDLGSAVAVRFFAGFAASPMSSLSFLYLLECFPPEKKMNVGISLAMINLAIGTPIARLISPTLLDIGGWHSLYMVEVGFAMVSLAAIYTLPLTSPPKTKVIHPLDIVTYLFIAVGFGALAVGLSLGRYYWWLEAPWIGWTLAAAIACLVTAAVIELNRDFPLLDIRWLVSPPILHFAGVLMLFRILMSEQTSGVAGYFMQTGLLNEQMYALNWIILAASIAGGLICAVVLKPGREPFIHLAALALLAAGAWLDSNINTLTRPEQFYLGQAMVAGASALFLPPALAAGFGSALKKGMGYIFSFVVVFLATQSLGGLLGSALFGTFMTLREMMHSNGLAGHLVVADPNVSLRISQLGGAYAHTLTDPVLRGAEGAVQLAAQVRQQAYAMAYSDAIFLVFLGASAAFLLLAGHIAWQALARWNAAPAHPLPQS